MKLLCRSLLLFFLSAPVFAASGEMTKNEELRATASASGAVVAHAAKGASVEILARQGGWTQISSGGKTGWVRILSVRSTGQTASAGDVLGVVQAGTSKRDPGKVVAVAGLRGLNEEELKQAKFNGNELKKLDGYVSTRSDAERFARDAGLKAGTVSYLPSPVKEQRRKDSPWGDGGL